MELHEAYKTLGLDQGATKDDINKAFRELSKKHHPDRPGGNEEHYKKITEAKHTLENPQRASGGPSGSSMDDFFNHMNQQGGNFNPFAGFGGFGGFGNRGRQDIITPNITESEPIVNLKISFEESILGCKKSVTYERFKKCNDCKGSGFESIETCNVCHGSGHKAHIQGNMQFISECNKCHGSGKHGSKNCQKCNGIGGIKESVTSELRIPAGVELGSILQVGQAGHFHHSVNGHDQYSLVIIPITVEKDKEMTLEGNDVITSLQISLLQALKGDSIEVRTVKGNKKLKIPEKVKNMDKLRIAGCGVSERGGNHIFIINVKYPDNVEELIKCLEEKK